MSTKAKSDPYRQALFNLLFYFGLCVALALLFSCSPVRRAIKKGYRVEARMEKRIEKENRNLK